MIDWTSSHHGGDKRLILRWVERGGPPVSAPTEKGFGSWVLERGIAHELDGKVSLEYQPDGVSCTIDIPDPSERPI